MATHIKMKMIMSILQEAVVANLEHLELKFSVFNDYLKSIFK